MEAVVERENMLNAYRRVVSNKGAAGVDAMGVDELKPFLQTHWERIKEQLLEGSYQPTKKEKWGARTNERLAASSFQSPSLLEALTRKQ